MILEQSIVFGVLGLALVLFVFGKWRYDIVALLALLVVAITGVVSTNDVFVGFGHPAVVTVAAVLVVSKGLQNSGIVDLIARYMSKTGSNISIQIFCLTSLVAVFSAFMNNVGALALMMPVAIRMARKSDQPASLLLMPLAFGSLLGGLVTLIGTPPNIIIASFRTAEHGGPFQMFDFAPVGAGIAFLGILFISFIGWRLLPHRKGATSREELFKIEDYVTEVQVPVDSSLIDSPVGLIETKGEFEVAIVGIVRGERRLPAPSGFEVVKENDILIVQADSDALNSFLDSTGFELEGSKQLKDDVLKSDNISIVEAVVTPDSRLIKKTAQQLYLRLRYGVNILAVARQDEFVHERVGKIKFKSGDIILLQGKTDIVQDTLADLGILPLADRGLRIGHPKRVLLALSIFVIALALSAFNILAVQVSFVACAVTMVLTKLMTLKEAYGSIDWPVIVLLAAMIPVGISMETTGGAQMLADTLLNNLGGFGPEVAMIVLLLATMALSNVINNAAAAVLMGPIGINIAQSLSVSIDPFLMAVAVGASSAFLTPIGHQSNTLVMRPGGYKFSDYWRMGLPLQIIIIIISVPLILRFWPI